MNLENLYIFPHKTGTEVFPAFQYTGAECLEPGHPFLQFIGNWISTSDPEYLHVLENGARFLIRFGSTRHMVKVDDWLVDLPTMSYPSIDSDVYFREVYRPLMYVEPTVSPADSRVNVAGITIYSGAEEVRMFIEKLVGSHRLAPEAADVLLGSELMDDEDVSIQIYSCHRAGRTWEEIALGAPYRAPLTVQLNPSVEITTTNALGLDDLNLLPCYNGEDEIVSLLYTLNERGLINDFILNSALALPHYSAADDVSAAVENNVLRISAPDCVDAEVPLMVPNLANNPVPTGDQLDDRFYRFTQLMKVKLREMGAAPMDHQVLLGGLAKTLTDPEDEDQFITIAVYAMCLQELGEFTVGQLLEVNDQDESPLSESPIIDIGDEFNPQKV